MGRRGQGRVCMGRGVRGGLCLGGGLGAGWRVLLRRWRSKTRMHAPRRRRRHAPPFPSTRTTARSRASGRGARGARRARCPAHKGRAWCRPLGGGGGGCLKARGGGFEGFWRRGGRPVEGELGVALLGGGLGGREHGRGLEWGDSRGVGRGGGCQGRRACAAQLGSTTSGTEARKRPFLTLLHPVPPPFPAGRASG